MSKQKEKKLPCEQTFGLAIEKFEAALVERGKHLCPDERRDYAEHLLAVAELENSLIPDLEGRLCKLEEAKFGAAKQADSWDDILALEMRGFGKHQEGDRLQQG